MQSDLAEGVKIAAGRRKMADLFSLPGVMEVIGLIETVTMSLSELANTFAAALEPTFTARKVFDALRLVRRASNALRHDQSSTSPRGHYCLKRARLPKSILVVENLKLRNGTNGCEYSPFRVGRGRLRVGHLRVRAEGVRLSRAFATRFSSQRPAMSRFELASGHLHVSRFGVRPARKDGDQTHS